MSVMSRSMYITSPQVPGTHALLNDTGAQFSAISLRLAKINHLHVQPVLYGEPMNLHLAEKSKIVPRIGSEITGYNTLQWWLSTSAICMYKTI